MYSKRIRLKDIPQVHAFVKLADQCEFDVNIGYDRVCIDAKSIVGVMGLDLGRILEVTFDGTFAPLEQFCEEHAVG